MKRYIVLTIITLFPLFGIGIFLASDNKENNSIEIYPKLEVLKDVAALGTLTPDGEIRKLAAPSDEFGISPRISLLYVEEGDFVKKGDILADLESRIKLKIKKNKLVNQIELNKNEIDLQKQKIGKYKKALAKGGTSEVSLIIEQDKLLRFENKRVQLNSNIQLLDVDLQNSQLKSPIDGYILSINTREGERPQSDGILEVGASQVMKAVIEVYESDINRVYIGQNVYLVSENGGFDENLYGDVERISPQVKQRAFLSTDPTGDADARVIEVLVRLDKNSSDSVSRFAGMKVIAKFLSE